MTCQICKLAQKITHHDLHLFRCRPNEVLDCGNVMNVVDFGCTLVFASLTCSMHTQQDKTCSTSAQLTSRSFPLESPPCFSQSALYSPPDFLVAAAAWWVPDPNWCTGPSPLSCRIMYFQRFWRRPRTAALLSFLLPALPAL